MRAGPMLKTGASHEFFVLLMLDCFTTALCYDGFCSIGCFYRMAQPQVSRVRLRLGFRAWVTIIVGLFILGLVLVGIAVLALGVFLFVLPVIAVTALLYYLFPSRFRTRRYRQRADISIIDGEFRVVHPADTERQRLEEGP